MTRGWFGARGDLLLRVDPVAAAHVAVVGSERTPKDAPRTRKGYGGGRVLLGTSGVGPWRPYGGG